jgi:hypothetical protein
LRLFGEGTDVRPNDGTSADPKDGTPPPFCAAATDANASASLSGSKIELRDIKANPPFILFHLCPKQLGLTLDTKTPSCSQA